MFDGANPSIGCVTQRIMMEGRASVVEPEKLDRGGRVMVNQVGEGQTIEKGTFSSN